MELSEFRPGFRLHSSFTQEHPNLVCAEEKEVKTGHFIEEVTFVFCKLLGIFNCMGFITEKRRKTS